MAYRRGADIINFSPRFIPFVVVFELTLVAVRLIDWLLYRITIRGRENLPAGGPAVLVSNHTLLLDPGIIAHAVSPRRTYFTMLEETALIPFLGTFVLLPLALLPIQALSGNPAMQLTFLCVVTFLAAWSLVLWDRGMRWWTPFLYPVLFVHLLFIAWWSFAHAATGQGVVWKGRTLH